MPDPTFRFCRTKCVKVKSRTDEGQAFQVIVAGDDELHRKHSRTFPWGEVAGATISWQSARGRALKYAHELATRLWRPHAPEAIKAPRKRVWRYVVR